MNNSSPTLRLGGESNKEKPSYLVRAFPMDFDFDFFDSGAAAATGAEQVSTDSADDAPPSERRPRRSAPLADNRPSLSASPQSWRRSRDPESDDDDRQ